MNAALQRYADPEILALVDRLVAEGHPESLVQAARAYAETDAEFSRALAEAREGVA